MTGMDLAVHYCGTDLSMPLVDVARAALDRGFTGLYLAEHTHFPVRRRYLYPGVLPRDGAEFVEMEPLHTAEALDFRRYQRLLDPYVGLAFVAGAVPDFRLGTCVALPAQHDAIALAKQVASLDHLSGGRFVLGVGTGWVDEEFANHGLDPADRIGRMRESVLLMRALWENEVVEFHGERFDMQPSHAWPKATRTPVLLGCRALRGAFGQLVEWADGWIPMSNHTAGELPDQLRLLHAMWADAGRADRPQVRVMQGLEEADTLRRSLDALTEHGVDEVLLEVPTEGPDGVLRTLDDWAALIPR